MFNPLNLIGDAVKAVGGYFTEKQRQNGLEKEHKNEMLKLEMQTQLEVVKANGLAKIEFAKTGQQQDFNLDMMAMKNMNKSYKDEFLLIVFIVPMIMAFVPSLSEYALRGFEIVALMPDWYVYFIIGMGVVIYGLRGLLKWALNSKPKIIRL